MKEIECVGEEGRWRRKRARRLVRNFEPHKKKISMRKTWLFPLLYLRFFPIASYRTRKGRKTSHKYIERRSSLVRGFPFFLGFRLTTARIFLSEMFFFLTWKLCKIRLVFVWCSRKKKTIKSTHKHNEHLISLILSSSFFSFDF